MVTVLVGILCGVGGVIAGAFGLIAWIASGDRHNDD